MEIEAQFDVFPACILFHPSGAYGRVLYDTKNAPIDFVEKGVLTTLTLLLVLLCPLAEHRTSTSSISAQIGVVSGVIMQCFVIIQPGNVVPISLFSVYSCLKFANRKGRINW